METQLILIVDDEAAITDALAVLFEKAGYRALIAHSGAEALARLAERPHLLVLDVMMPDLDGYEVCRRARARADYIPILMLTAKDASWERVAGLELGADAYLTKPFEPGELLAQAKALLRLAGARGETPVERSLIGGPLQLWEKERRAELSGQPLELTPREFDLLRTVRGFGYCLTAEE